MASLRGFQKIANFRHIIRLSTCHYIKVSSISTSKKSKDTGSVAVRHAFEVNRYPPSDTEPVEVTNKYWESYGFSEECIYEDNTAMHVVFFFIITLMFVGVAFSFAYLPDQRMKEWALREAFLEIRRREKEGLPLIDKEFVPLERIVLPTDEELEKLGIEVTV